MEEDDKEKYSEMESRLKNHLDEKFLELRKELEDRTYTHRKEIQNEFHQNLKEHKEEVDRHLSRYVKWISAGATLIAIFGAASFYTSGLDTIKGIIVERLDEEFSKDNMQETINTTAVHYIKQNAQKDIGDKVDFAIKDYSKGFHAEIYKANEEVERLKEFTTIFELKGEAEFGSRKSYEKLLTIAKSKSNYSALAKKSVQTLQLDLYNKYGFPPGMILENWYFMRGNSVNLESGDLSTKQLFSYLQHPDATHENRIALMDRLIRRPKNEVISEGLNILEKSDSLPACAAVCGILADEKMLGRKADFLDFDGWATVCKKELAVTTATTPKL